MKAGELAQKLAYCADRVAMELLPNGKRDGNEWRCGSTDGQEGKSLGVHLTGTKAGVWADFSAGTGGDLLDLWQAVRGCGLVEAMGQAGKFLGIATQEPERKTYPKPKKPDSELVSHSIRPFTTSANTPSVTRISGKVRIFISGRSVLLMTPKTNATKRNGSTPPV